MSLESFYQRDKEEEALCELFIRYAIAHDTRPFQKVDDLSILGFLKQEEFPDDIYEAMGMYHSSIQMVPLRIPYWKNEVASKWDKIIRLSESIKRRYDFNSLQSREKLPHKDLRCYFRLTAYRVLFVPERDPCEWETTILQNGIIIEKYEKMREETLEMILYKEPSLIEEGLVFTARQVEVHKGRIDLVGKDIRGATVLCEVKVEEDKDVLWQAGNYPRLYQDKYGKRKELRMIVVSPQMQKSLEEELKEKGTEIFHIRNFPTLHLVPKKNKQKILNG
ncbi:endonuclease NucS domain-containing protein [Psychrobacillus sp. FSL K6-1464]|uniref:endonuclease NucS domain-containing protein n=1 Tax=Psychrobacillus sp. FSL K6-1464 TaxID=2921545 RepID=UPI0030FCA554